ncbi:MAG: hypothetical protein RBU29_03685, partial [bacterium]|nr:hypothetical protein [bacterium]
AADAREFRQRVLCVLNNRGRDRVELDHPDLKGVVSFFGAEKLHVLPKLTGKRMFQREPEFISLLDALFREKEPAGIKPLLKKAGPLAQALVEENRRRKTALLRMERKITDTIEDRIQKDAAVSFKDVLNDEVFTALDHLGLKRFAITNFWTFIKRVGNTWSFKQSFQAAFGSNRHQTLSQMLTINTDKLEDEVRSRISDHTEELRRLLHRQEESAILIQANPDFKTLAFIKAMPLQTMLQEIAREFETEIRDTLSEDKLAAALKNDPILVLSVLGVFLVDMLTIPGFFSWLGVPTLFKFLPIGKFDKMKRRFQQSIRDLIREALMQTVIQIKNSRSQLILEDQDPIYHALTICTEDHEY